MCRNTNLGRMHDIYTSARFDYTDIYVYIHQQYFKQECQSISICFQQKQELNFRWKNSSHNERQLLTYLDEMDKFVMFARTRFGLKQKWK